MRYFPFWHAILEFDLSRSKKDAKRGSLRCFFGLVVSKINQINFIIQFCFSSCFLLVEILKSGDYLFDNEVN